MKISEVYITKSASFFPNSPVSNDEMESCLGVINEQASKSRRIVLRNNKITSRFYALTKDGKPTHSNAEMAALSIKNMLPEEQRKEVDLLTCGTSSMEQLMPSHAVMTHGHLPELGPIEVVSPAGVCCSGMHALKYAYMAVQLGQAKKAIATASERFSPSLKADKFELEVQKMKELENNAILAFDKDFLRWMLSDGAGSFLLENKPNSDGISLKIEWIEGVSYANQLEPCMYMGATKNEDGTLNSYLDHSSEELLQKSVMSIKQDVKLLGANIYQLGTRKMKELLEKHQIKDADIDWFLPHISSFFFHDKMYQEFLDIDVNIPLEKWFTNLATKGNTGAAAIYTILDDLIASKTLKKGQKIMLAVPESSRFSYVFCYLTVC